MQVDLAEALEKIAQLALDAVDLSSSIYPNDYEAPFDDMRALLGAGGPALKLRVYSFFCAAVSMVFCLKCFREHPEVGSVSSSAVSSVGFVVCLKCFRAHPPRGRSAGSARSRSLPVGPRDISGPASSRVGCGVRSRRSAAEVPLGPFLSYPLGSRSRSGDLSSRHTSRSRCASVGA